MDRNGNCWVEIDHLNEAIWGGGSGEDVANMDPQGDELDRLCDQYPVSEEWEWDG